MKFLKKLSKGIIITYVVLFALSQLVSGCFSFRMSDKEINESFARYTYKPQQADLDVDDRTIHYVSVGKPTLPVAFFVHGSPGSWSAFVDFFKDSTLLQQVQMVSVDRPGFGDSEAGWGENRSKGKRST